MTPSRSSTSSWSTAATPSPTRCSSTSPRRWRATAGCGSRSTPCTAWFSSPPTAPCSKRSSAARRCSRSSASASTPTPSPCTPSERGHLKQVLLKLGWPAEDLAGYVDGEAHAIGLVEDGWSMRNYQREAVEGFWHGGSGVVVLPCGAGKTIVGAAAMARGAGDDAHPGDEHRRGAAVAARAAQAHDADRGRDRRVLRLAQGGPTGHHRDVPGDDHAPEGRLHPPRAAGRARLGTCRVRRGAPAAGADLPDDRRPAGPPPTRPHRDARARGRPRG